METLTNFIFFGYKFTVDSDYSHEIKRCFLLGREAMRNPDSILKSRDITLPTKVCVVKVTFFFPVVMYRYESWTTKEAEHQRIDAFQLWCWRILLRVLLTARKSQQCSLAPQFKSINFLALSLLYGLALTSECLLVYIKYNPSIPLHCSLHQGHFPPLLGRWAVGVMWV